MYDILKKYIFNLDPEVAHDLAIKSLKLNFLPESLFRVEGEHILETKIFNQTIKNPIGLAAGFDKSAEVYNSLFNFGFGFIEVGTVTPRRQLGNPKPRVFRLEKDKALINRLGFNNHGSEIISKRISKNSPNGFLGINIGPNKDTVNKIDDFLICLSKFHNLGNYITINISSPNTEGLRDFHEKKSLTNLFDKIYNFKKEKNFSTPLVVKISPDIEKENISEIIEILFKFKIDGVIISNTSDKNRTNLNDEKKIERGGLSGSPIKKISTELIKTFYKELKNKIPIIGVGGVDSGDSAYEKISAGASALQLYTGMVYNGPLVIKDIKRELIATLKKEKINNIQEAVGINTWPILIQLLYNSLIMPKKCELTGVSPLKGHNVSHSNNKTKRRFLPNLKKVNFRSELLKRNIRLSVTNAALRTVDFKGGLDKFLQKAKNKNLSKRVKKIKLSIESKH